MSELTPQIVDWLLYNRHDIRREVDAIEPKTSTSIVHLPVRARPESSAIERVAVSRATITLILDAVDRAVATMPRPLRRLIRLRYTERMAVYGIARYVHWSERTCYRRLDAIRRRTISSLSLLDGQLLADFWQEIGRVLDRN